MRAILTLVLFVPLVTAAQEVTLKKITSDGSKFSATGADIQVGQTYTLNSDSSVCTAEVTKSNGRTGVFKVVSCDDRSALKPGDLFSLSGGGGIDSMSPVTNRRSHSTSDKFGIRYGVGGLFSSANKITYTLKDAFSSGSAEIATDWALGLDGSVHWLRPMSIGVSARVTYELPRKLKTQSVGANVQTLNDVSATIVNFQISANFAHEIGAYGYAGINYPYFMISWAGATLNPGMGYQVGGGYFITREIGVDMQMRFLRASGTYKMGILDQKLEEMKLDGFLISANYYIDGLF